jgi:hypothetical protein
LHLAYVEQQRLDGYATIVDHAVKRKRAFDKKVLKRAPREVIFKKGDLVQVYRSDLVHTVSTIKKLAPMWSSPRRISARKLNSYTLETLEGVPLNGLFNVRRLRAFKPRDGTKLALAEASRKEAAGDNAGLDEGADRVEEEDQITREVGDEVEDRLDGVLEVEDTSSYNEDLEGMGF